MNRKFKAVTLLFLTALVLSALPLAAQESETSKASHFFGTDVDDYMSYFGYSGVEFDNYFGFLGVAGEGTEAAVSLGYARRFGGIYVGAYYEGTIFAKQTNVEKSIISNFNGVGSRINENTTETHFPGFVYDPDNPNQKGDNWFRTGNRLDILIGVANMGIKVMFEEDLIGNLMAEKNPAYNNTNDDYIEKDKDYDLASGITTNNGYQLKSFDSIQGGIKPKLGWGMPLTLGNFTVKPKVEAGLTIYQASYKDTWDNTDDSESLDTVTFSRGKIGFEHYQTGYNDPASPALPFLTPDILVRADAAMPFGENGELGFGIGYNLLINIFAADYSVNGFSGSAGAVKYNSTKTVTENAISKKVVNNINVDLSDIFGMKHEIDPSVSYFKPLSDQVDIGFEGKLTFNFGNTNSETRRKEIIKTVVSPIAGQYLDLADQYTETSTTNLRVNKSDISDFTLTPEISVGATYRILPEKLTLNTGLGATLFKYSTETKFTTTYGNDNVTTTNREDKLGNTYKTKTDRSNLQITDTRTIVETWERPSVNVGLGFTLFFTPTFAMDTSAVTTLDSNETINNSGTGNDNMMNIDITRFNILFTIKK